MKTENTIHNDTLNLGNFNFSFKLKELEKMYYFINQEKYLDNINKYNFMSGDPIAYKAYPPAIKQIVKVLKKGNLYEYQPTNGNVNDKLIISKYLRNIGINACNQNITFTYSTTHAFNLIFECFGKQGDAIIIPTPNYGLFDFTPERYGLHVVPISLNINNNWLIDCDELEKTINFYNSNTKGSRVAFFYNMNPHNPTGKVMSENNKDILNELGALAIKYNFIIIDDLVYRDLTYDVKHMPVSISSFEKYFNNTISLFGISKSYNLAAIRSGFMVSNKKIATTIQNKIYHTMDSVSVINIKALTSAFNINNKKYYKKYFKKIMNMYLENYNLLRYLINGFDKANSAKEVKYKKIIKKYLSKSDYEYIFSGIKNIDFLDGLEEIESGFFALLKIKTNLNYYELFDKLFVEANVKVICGNSIMYTDNNEKIIRINFAVKQKDLVLGMLNFKKMIDNN